MGWDMKLVWRKQRMRKEFWCENLLENELFEDKGVKR
jgi:hypothetical protein